MKKTWTVPDELPQPDQFSLVIHSGHCNVQVLELLIFGESREHSLNLGLYELVPADVKRLEHRRSALDQLA